LLDVERSPTILFHSTRVDPSDETHARIIGQLTIRDTTRELVLRVARESGGRAGDGSLHGVDQY
jgi:polyisoprenoid-binding protein YceI